MQKEKNERQSNFELLRILLMLTIPTYHLMLYNGVYTMEYHKHAVWALFLSSGGAITADYAFIALSAYFLLEKKNVEISTIVRRFLSFAIQVLFLYVIRFVAIRGTLGYDPNNWFVEDYILGGAWWFILPYMALMLVYPLLNKCMEAMSRGLHLLVCLGLFAYFVWNSITLEMNFWHDLIAFLTTYFIMGYLRRGDYARWILPTKKVWMALIYLLGFLATFFICWYVKYPGHMENDAAANNIAVHLIGRYAPGQFVMGLAVFFLFKNMVIPQSKHINAFAKNVFFVFLLHETVMGLFWYVGKINGQYAYYSDQEFILWLIVYVGTCLLFGSLVGVLYRRWIGPVVERLVGDFCEKTIRKS